MKFVFNGLPYFGNKLVNDLKRFSPNHSFSFFDTYTSKLEQVKFAAALPFADLMISLNGVSDQSGSLDLVIKLNKKMLMHWQGTDTVLALEAEKKNTLYRKYIDHSSNYTDAPWMKDELNSIGISCGILEYKWMDVRSNNKPFEKTSAYTYLAEGKETFYGWEMIAHLAEKNPDIDFYLAGSEGKGLEKKKNTHFLGWISQEKMSELRADHPIFLRLPDHDGYSLSVIEALSSGNEVIWTMPHPQCHQATETDKIETVFQKAISELKNRRYMPNENNIQFVKNNFSKDKILSSFVKKLEEIAST